MKRLKHDFLKTARGRERLAVVIRALVIGALAPLKLEGSDMDRTQYMDNVKTNLVD